MSTERIRGALKLPAQNIEVSGARHAAVALLIDPQERVLFVQRAEREGDRWSGQIALPGGHLEVGESWLDAAMRETFEEIGVVLEQEGFIGRLNDLQTPDLSPTRVVRPHVFAVQSLNVGPLQASEVADVHVLRLDQLLAGEGRAEFVFDFRGRGYTLPCVDFGEQRLWGLTLRMIDDLLHRIDGRGQGLERPISAGVSDSGLF